MPPLMEFPERKVFQLGIRFKNISAWKLVRDLVGTKWKKFQKKMQFREADGFFNIFRMEQ